MELTRADRFEEPSGDQLTRLGELIAERTDNAWWRHMRATNEESSSWVFRLSNPLDFERADGLVHSEFIDVKWDALGEDQERATLLIQANRKSEDGRTIFVDFYKLWISKISDKVIKANMISADANELAKETGDCISPEISQILRSELALGKCDAGEVERLIRMFQDATPVIDFDVDDEEENIYNSIDE